MSNDLRTNSTSSTSLSRKWRIPIMSGLAALVLVTSLAAIAISRHDSGPATSTANSAIFSSPHSYSTPVTEAKSVKLNGPVPNFSASDIDGKKMNLVDWKGNLVLLFFADLSCPCVQAYNGRMKELQREYSGQGLQIAYVFSDPKDTLANIQKLAKAEQYPWRNLRDADQKLLNLFNAQCTTEAFLIDREGVLRYHGRVDDSTFEPDQAKSPDLKNAITALLNNRPVPVAETQAYACTIPKLKPKKSQKS